MSRCVWSRDVAGWSHCGLDLAAWRWPACSLRRLTCLQPACNLSVHSLPRQRRANARTQSRDEWDYSEDRRTNTLRTVSQFFCVIFLLIFVGSWTVDFRNAQVCT